MENVDNEMPYPDCDGSDGDGTYILKCDYDHGRRTYY